MIAGQGKSIDLRCFSKALRLPFKIGCAFHARSPPPITHCFNLRVVDLASKRVFYLDPKLYVSGSRDNSFRAFYFEPKIDTNKVRDEAVHLVVGFEHEPRKKTGAWKFTRWDLVDLAQFKVKLKAEFQGVIAPCIELRRLRRQVGAIDLNHPRRFG